MSANRIAIVTGAAGRIGGATVRRFVADGIRVVATDHNEAGLADTLASLSAGHSVVPVVADLLDRAQVDGVIDRAVEAFGPPDILVNSAGGSAKLIGQLSDFESSDPAVWDWILRLNVSALLACCQSALRVMPRSSGSRIINLASIAGVVGLAGRADYSAAKGAVIAFSQALAMELAPTGLTVNAVSPGQIGDNGDPRGTYLHRIGQPDEVANVIAFLARADAGYVTGQNYIVDGGRTLGPMDGALLVQESRNPR